MSEWTKFVSAFYKKKHAANPNYQFKDALKEAAKVYKKGSSSSSETTGKTKSKKSRKSRKVRTMKKRGSRKH